MRMVLEGYHDITHEQALAIHRLELDQRKGKALAMSAVVQVLGMPDWAAYRISPIVWVEELLPRLSWIASDRVERLPSNTLRIAKVDYLLPAAYLRDMPVQQYLWAEEAYEQLTNAKHEAEEQAIKFCAQLLRPKTKHALRCLEEQGVQPICSNAKVEAIAQVLRESVQPELLLYLLRYYSTQRELLKAQFPNLHNQPKETAAAQAKTDWAAIPALIAESGVFGSLTDVLSASTYSYLAWGNAKASVAEKPKTLQEIIREKHNNHLN